MKKIIIYTSAHCPYCTRAKDLLKSKHLNYHEIRVDEDDAALNKMIELSGRRSVPQIFIDDEHIGGSDDLVAYFKNHC